jgi:glycerol kinase
VLGRIAETTALGVAYLAGVGADRWTLSDVRELAGAGSRAGEAAERPSFEARRYEPQIDEQQRERLLAGWADALARARSAG